jgi:penicillin-binding protein 1A
VAGTFAARAAIEGPLHRPAAWQVEADVDLAGLHRGAAAAALDGPFTHRARVTPESAREVTVGPRNPDFVPVSALPPHVVRAVTVSEDAGFFAHRGFDFVELSQALSDGERRARLRGASTISQQVAKNLFLGPERTLARKAREALLTVALETTLRKQRILEIYLNIAEWGPGVFGIGEAARHWFGKDARALTPREAAFLATIIPNPARHGGAHARGAPSPAWDARVDALLVRLRELRVLSDEELDAALGERLSFTQG